MKICKNLQKTANEEQEKYAHGYNNKKMDIRHMSMKKSSNKKEDAN